MKACRAQRVIALIVATWIFAAAGPVYAEPLRTAFGETSSSRLLARLIRIEPVKGGSPEVCLGLTSAGLNVTLRGRSISPEAVDLARPRPPTVHAIAIDTSASLVGALPFARLAAAEYIKRLRPESDRAFVLSFDETVMLGQAVTADRERLLDAVEGVRMGGPTALLDGTYYAMRELDSHRARPVLILLTDGVDTLSVHDEEDVLTRLAARPDLTVFVIGLGIQVEHGDERTQDLLERLAASPGGQYYDVSGGSDLGAVFADIRAKLEREAVVTVADPDPAAGAAKLRIRSGIPDCRITVLGPADPAADEAPASASTGAFPGLVDFAPLSEYRKLYTRSARRSADPACTVPDALRRAADEGWFEPTWFVRADRKAALFCGPDLILEPGPLYSPQLETMVSFNEQVSIRTRPLRIEIRPLAQLPTRPQQLMARLAATALERADQGNGVEYVRLPQEDHARPHYDYPSLAHGMTLQGMRAHFASALYAHPEYRSWAQGKLAARAAGELARIEQRFLARYPQLPPARVAEAVRQSEEGRRILARVRSPTGKDLQAHLAAWLGDLSAQQLFAGWERERIDRALTTDASPVVDEDFLRGWRELRRVFFAPSYVRSLTLLDPVHDLECDCVGFWRVVLPRASWFHARAIAHEIDGVAAVDWLDLLPDQPFGAWILDRLARAGSEWFDYLRDRAYRTDRLAYESLVEASLQRPESAFERTRVTLILVPPDGSARLEVVGDLRFDPLDGEAARPVVEALNVDVEGDAALGELVRRARGDLLRMVAPQSSDSDVR